eukprot:GHVU01005871.1.p1 GENE.GHVU01005871.1~~GHVU01005871.1.p1  ORF type:complete len:149 (+),score=13.50 GHVU01005871.1:100-546(+)
MVNEEYFDNKWTAYIQGKENPITGEWKDILSICESEEDFGSYTALRKVLNHLRSEWKIEMKSFETVQPNLYMRTFEGEWIQLDEGSKVKKSFFARKAPKVLKELPEHLQFLIAAKDVSPSTRRGGGQGGSPAVVDVPSTPVMLHRLRP